MQDYDVHPLYNSQSSENIQILTFNFAEFYTRYILVIQL